MEIITLVKAGLKNRKGIMTGFMLLTMLIVVSVITMFGVRKNYESSKDKAYETEDKGVIFGFFQYNSLSDELIEKVEAEDTVDHLEIYDTLVGVNVSIGDTKDGNGFMVVPLFDTIPIMNEDCTELINPGTQEYEKLALKKGEIYLPYGLVNKLDAKTGDKIYMEFLGESREFTIKGFVQEAYMGSSIIGYKTVFISDEEFDELYTLVKENFSDEETDRWSYGKIAYVFPSEKANASSDIFLRELTLKTKFNDMAYATLTRQTSEHYTGVFIEIILAVITGFAVLLFAIFLIVAGHNISTEMEIEYKNLGILKSQGFTDGAIRSVYILQYLLVELVGIILGVIISVPFERIMSRIFFTLTAIIPDKKIPVMESAVFTVLLFAVTFVFIYFATRKVSKTSPVKAITNGRDDFYFDSRLNVPIRKWLMSFWIGLRQITSAPKRYISIVIVTSLLVFTIITVELMGGFITSRKALDSMGEPFTDINFSFHSGNPDGYVEDIESIVRKHTEIEQRIYKSHVYTSMNGESIMTIVKAYPDEFSSVYKGREVKFDNEIVVTDQICRLLDVKIGDTVTIGRKGYDEEYVIVGIFQTMNDTGKAISMSLGGISRLKEDPDDVYSVDYLGMYGLVLKDTTDGEEIVKEIKDKYGDEIDIEFADFENDDLVFVDSFYTASEGSKIMIYTLSIIFALVTVIMVCAKAFIQERTDLGIYRATGFSVGRIRVQYAARFMIVALFSSVIGALISRLYSAKLLSILFSMFGIPHIEMEYSLWLFMKPIIIFLIGYFVFGYISSRKVKKLSSRELITE